MKLSIDVNELFTVGLMCCCCVQVGGDERNELFTVGLMCCCCVQVGGDARGAGGVPDQQPRTRGRTRGPAGAVGEEELHPRAEQLQTAA